MIIRMIILWSYIGCVPLFTANTANSISPLLFTEC